jgi:ATP-dependent DNA helicase RecG
MELCRVKIVPPLIPYFERLREVEPGKDVAVIRILSGPDKPYARFHDNRRTYFIRVGSTSREADAEELARMFQESGRVRYGLRPVPGAGLNALDRRRLRGYLTSVLGGQCPDDQDEDEWITLLRNLELMTLSGGEDVATIDGLLLFGYNPKRFLPQSGFRAIAYAGNTPDYAARADQDLVGPILPLFGTNGALLETGIIEQALDFIQRNTQPSARIEGGRRIDIPTYPPEVVREVVVNAVAHRDYSRAGADNMLTIFEDRLEITSPGRLPNSATVEAIKAGLRYARNQTLVNILRDYRYVDARGMGIRNKVIPGMRTHNDTEPEFDATEHAFTVLLWKEKKE